MLPKVANHVLHTARAVGAQQHQAFRNALQSSGSGSGGSITSWSSVSSSSYGNAGAGAGGAKYHAGSRFYSGYTGAGRAVTQADQSGADSSNGDENDDIAAHRAHLRKGRSSHNRTPSMSLRAMEKRPEGSVLKSVKAHVRGKKTFSAETANDPSLSRQLSTEALTHEHDLNSPPQPFMLSEKTSSPGFTSASQLIRDAMASGDREAVLGALEMFRTAPGKATVADYNVALQSLYDIRRPGESLRTLLETYNEMIQRQLVPNGATYRILIQALCARDADVAQLISGLEQNLKTSHLPADLERIQERLDRLKGEDNYSSALSLFQAMAALHATSIGADTYLVVLRTCASRGAIDAMLQVWSHLEARNDIVPPAEAYGYLIDAYTSCKDLDGVKEVFADFRLACAADGVFWDGGKRTDAELLEDHQRTGTARNLQLSVWNETIVSHVMCGDSVGAIALLEEMLQSAAPPLFGVADVPPPTPMTYTRLIEAFSATGDVDTALSWLTRLASQDEPAGHPLMPSVNPRRPSSQAWQAVFQALAGARRVSDFNRILKLYLDLAPKDGLPMVASHLQQFMAINLDHLYGHSDLPKTEAVDILLFMEQVLHGSLPVQGMATHLGENRVWWNKMVDRWLQYGERQQAATCLLNSIMADMKIINQVYESEQETYAWVESQRDATYKQAKLTRTQIFRNPGESVDLKTILAVTRMDIDYKQPVNRFMIATVLDSYGLNKPIASTLSTSEWEILLSISVSADGENRTAELFDDAVKAGLRVEEMDVTVVLLVVSTLLRQRGSDEVKEFLKKLGPAVESVFVPHVTDDLPSRTSESSTAPASPTASSATAVELLRIDPQLSQLCLKNFARDEHRKKNGTVIDAVKTIRAAAQKGAYADPRALANFFKLLAPNGHVDEAHELYQIAQATIEKMDDPKAQRAAWLAVEDSMVSGLAVSDNAAAHVHRARMLSAGSAPSSDAYGSLISALNETTDDAAAAIELFNEARAHNQNNLSVFLYNNMISKLAKARKVDYALDMFASMKQEGIKPTSVTYGAVIGACCRVGDAHSAEILFAEMMSQDLYPRPRVPAFNTMMQLYVQIHPNREKMLSFYHHMLRAGVAPTEHTYKLLLDAHGTIEPIDLTSMERVFKDLEADKKVRVSGVHWASLINAYGCVSKNLDRAIQIFESVSSHPDAKYAHERLPDAVTFEALVGALVVNRRMDLLPSYLTQLEASGTHMTAYIANAIIRGHAASGDLDAARTVFEGMADPPVGVAAPNNHAPHVGKQQQQQQAVSSDAPVYREPSTWEVMLRAELGGGHRENALELLERLKHRQYPRAVYNRISGIMLDDDAVSPWPASTQSQPNSS